MNRILVYGMTSNPGGIESYIMNTFSLLDRKKAVFDFMVDFSEMCYREEAENMGSRIFFIPPKGKKLFAHLLAVWKLLRAHPEYKIIYFNVLDALSAITMVIPFILGRKIIVHSHNGSTANMKMHRIMKPFLNFFCHKRVACSSVAGDYMFSGKNVLIIPNAVDCKKYIFDKEKRNALRQELSIGEDTLCVGFIGRLSYQKNVPFLLDVFSEICKKNPSSVLLIAGDGEERDALFEKAKSLSIENNVKFLGIRSDIPEILSCIDVFVMTSFFEGLSVVAVEAQSSGVPCVFSSEMSKETKINPNVYFLGIDENPSVWADKIISLRFFPRIGDFQLLSDRGFDLNTPGEALCELFEIFYI